MIIGIATYKKIAWFITNGGHDSPIDIDVGVPSYGVDFTILDGNHRLAACDYLQKDSIRAYVCGDYDYAIELGIIKEES